MRLAYGNGGWIQVTLDSGPEFYVRVVLVQDKHGRDRAEIRDLYLPNAIDPAFVRTLPLSRVVALVNRPESLKRLTSRMSVPGPDLQTAAGYFATTVHQPPRTWPERMLDSQGPETDEPTPRAPRPRRSVETRPTRRRKLDVPTTYRKPHSFYQQVAALYMEIASSHSNPAAIIAEANNLPRTTIHRWVKEARKRHFLPPGKPGAAG